MESEKVPYTKVPVSHQELLAHLKSKGLTVENERQALHYLKFVGYYRLRGYALALQTTPQTANGHTYGSETNFDKIVKLYQFDKALRTAAIDALERIEIAFRCIISETGCATGGAHWFLNEKYYSKDESAREILNSFQAEFEKKNKRAQSATNNSQAHQSSSSRTPVREKNRFTHGFIEHYYRKYSEPDLPPSWMIFETLSFGTLSFVFSNLSSRLKKDIARIFDLGPETLVSWLRGLSYFRNLCAHHSRVWNRTFTIKSISDASQLSAYKIPTKDKFYHLACIVHYFLQYTKGCSSWKNDLTFLLGKYPEVDKIRMGFPDEWDKFPPWSD